MKSMRIHTVCQLAVVVVLTTVLCLGSIVSPSVANATVYYVATDGNDANPGGQSQPFRTIKKGVSVLKAGDTLYLRQGTYNESIEPAAMQIPSGTSWTNAITIAGYSGEMAIITSINIQDNFDLSVAAFLIFNNLKMSNYRVAGSSHHIRLIDSEVDGKGQVGSNNLVMIIEGTTNHEVIRCRVHGAEPGAYGFYIKAQNMLIEGNEIYNNGGYGIHLYASGHNDVNNNIVRNNIIYGNGFSDGPRGLSVGAVIIASGNNNQFYNNIVYSNTGTAVSVAYTNGGTNNQIYNNTVYGNTGIGIEINTSAPQTVVRNNIVYGNGNVIVDWGATGTVQSSNLTTNPQFVNASAHDFSLQAGSQAIDAGVAISAVTTDIQGVARPKGTSYDIGAYEYGKGLTPLSAPSNFRIASQ
jgi:parallel beta-helix repeat protein